MGKYLTNQRKTLISFLSEHPDEQLSAGQIASALENKGISLSAVYRNLSLLEADEKVKRCPMAGARDVLYQYIAAESCAGRLHLSCTCCGKTVHMSEVTSDNLINRIDNSEDFLVDKGNTVLYGLCKKCRNK